MKTINSSEHKYRSRNNHLHMQDMQVEINEKYVHLSSNACHILSLDNSKRIEWLRSPLWIGYPKAQQVLRKLDVLFNYPRKDRMPNLLLVGDTNNGKTTIIKRFIQLHQPSVDEITGKASLPIFFVQVPPVPDESRLYNAMLEKLLAPYKDRERPDKKLFQVIRILNRIDTKMIVLDEIHHTIAGNLTKQRQFLNAIKYFCNELKMPLVGVGTKDAFNAIHTDPQLSNRFEPIVLPRWEMNDEYLRLLASFEQMLPLARPSNLTEATLANRILGMSEGIIGEISAILTEAAVLAIETGTEQITVKILSALDYTSPSERKRRKL